MKELVIVGGGFAGVWAALGAVRAQRQIAPDAPDVAVTLVSRDRWLTIRPRLYEASLDDVRVPLDAVLGPAGVARMEGDVRRIDPSTREITIDRPSGARVLRYDRLVLAAGSQLHRPALPGIEHAFAVDRFVDAVALQQHLAALSARPPTSDEDGRFTAVVAGAGFTGIEVATELAPRLQELAANVGAGDRARVVLVDGASMVAPDLGADARRYVEHALAKLGIESRTGRTVAAVRSDGVMLNQQEWIPAATVIWTGGLRASGLAAQLPVEGDADGRVPVDAFLRVRGVDGVFAAGDVARAMADATHVAPMSCQYAIPMGERAGSNAVADLLGQPPTPYLQPNHVTCLDLGGAGALFMQGWEREVKLTDFWAKTMKQAINTRLIYPFRGGVTSDRMSRR
jgi:NADH dehydrogenase